MIKIGEYRRNEIVGVVKPCTKADASVMKKIYRWLGWGHAKRMDE